MHRDPRPPSLTRYLIAGLGAALLVATGTASAIAITGATPRHIAVAYLTILAAGAGTGLTLGLRARRNWRNS